MNIFLNFGWDIIVSLISMFTDSEDLAVLKNVPTMNLTKPVFLSFFHSGNRLRARDRVNILCHGGFVLLIMFLHFIP